MQTFQEDSEDLLLKIEICISYEKWYYYKMSSSLQTKPLSKWAYKLQVLSVKLGQSRTESFKYIIYAYTILIGYAIFQKYTVLIF
jgi:uncharacterized membrane protein